MTNEASSSNLVVIAFEGLDIAGEVLSEVEALEQAGEIVVEDAVIAQRRQGSLVDVTQARAEPTSARKATTRGGAVGFVAGLLVGGPIVGLVAGLAIGHLTSSMRDHGIDDSFIDGIGEALAPDSSALFLLLVHDANVEKSVAILRAYKGRLLKTTLTAEQEATLRKALDS